MVNAALDLVVRIKNGYLSKKELIEARYSKMAEEIAKILVEEKYIQSYKVHESENKKTMKITLSYQDNAPAVSDIQIISKPGQRIYSGVSELKPVLGGLGKAILTTEKGLMTDKKARSQKTGGEVLFKIW